MLQEGAKLVQNVDDILVEVHAQLSLFATSELETKTPVELDEPGRKVFDALSAEARHIDELTRQLQLNPAQLMSILLELECKNLIKQLPGKLFVKMK